MIPTRVIFLAICWSFIEPEVEAFVNTFPTARLVAFRRYPPEALRRRFLPGASFSYSPPMQRVFGSESSEVSQVGLEPRMSEGRVVTDVAATSNSHATFDALIDQFKSPPNGNITATVEDYLDLCDHALLSYIREEISRAGEGSESVRHSGPRRKAKSPSV